MHVLYLCLLYGLIAVM